MSLVLKQRSVAGNVPVLDANAAYLGINRKPQFPPTKWTLTPVPESGGWFPTAWSGPIHPALQ